MNPLFLHHLNKNPMETIESNLIPICNSCHVKLHAFERLTMSVEI